MSQRSPRRHAGAVWLRVYDITNGNAARWSSLLLGKKLEGIWHSGVRVFGMEYFYGNELECLPPWYVETNSNMEIAEEQLLGYTTKSKAELKRFLRAIQGCFTPETYDLVNWNCNHFADTLVRYLLDGRGIPDDILELPQIVQSTCIGSLIVDVIAFARRACIGFLGKGRPLPGPLVVDQVDKKDNSVEQGHGLALKRL